MKRKSPLLEALQTEIRLQADYLGGRAINTIYFGGGTPSLLSLEEINRLLDGLNKQFRVEPKVEITLEANPDDLTPAKIKDYIKAGINRFSLGVQSFFDEDLSFLNRRHDAAAAVNAIRDIQNAGCNHISIDLIFGIPGMTLKKWEQNLTNFLSFNIPHLSAYALAVEPKTALEVLIRKKKLPEPDENQTTDQFLFLMKKMRDTGFEHYEISNFARDGIYSLHNSNYWKGVPYLGVGPSAHSFNGESRQWNFSHLDRYFHALNENIPWFEKEMLSPVQKYNEYIMTSLRTSWGCDTKKIISDFGLTIYDLFRKQASPAIDKGLLFESSGIYFLTDRGKLFADGIAADLFWEEEGES